VSSVEALAQADDTPKQPAGIQPTIGQHDDRPARGDGGAQRAQQPQPFATPGMGLVGRQNGPGHGHGTATIDDADGQHREAGAQGGGIEGQGQLGSLPLAHDPLQQGDKAGLGVDGLPLVAPFRLGLIAPLAQLLPNRLLLASQPHGEERGHRRQGRGAREHHAQAP
jgi:hypothetical protein